MPIFALKLEKSGRILIPVEIRRRLGLEIGEDVLVSAEEDNLRILGNRRAAVTRVQERMRRFAPERILSEELIAERHREAAEETQG